MLTAHLDQLLPADTGPVVLREASSVRIRNRDNSSVFCIRSAALFSSALPAAKIDAVLRPKLLIHSVLPALVRSTASCVLPPSQPSALCPGLRRAYSAESCTGGSAAPLGARERNSPHCLALGSELAITRPLWSASPAAKMTAFNSRP